MRNKSIDILKFIGLLLIILAHTDPPIIIFQLRNFDVVLLIVCSSLIFFEINKSYNYGEYVISRIKRLLIPTYIFLIIYFMIMFLFSRNSVNAKVIFETFTLFGGLSYVWIIKVYIIIALLLPISQFLYDKIDKNIFFFITIIIYILYELMYYFGFFDNKIVDYLFAYIIPSFAIICYSLLLLKESNKKIIIYSILSFIVFVAIAIYLYNSNNCFVDTNCAKYPFRVYYLSYSFFIIGLLYVFINRYKDLLYNKLVLFFSSHSLWIYLWHILVLAAIQFILPNMYWLIKYVLILLFTTIIVLIQSGFVNILEKKNIDKKILKIFKG